VGLLFAEALSIGAPRVRALAVVCIAVSLAACGRIGPLEPPPNTTAAAAPAQAQTPDQTLNPQAAKPKIPPIMPPNQPFILDPLLK
jgi:predicted small lipoprotein YifL